MKFEYRGIHRIKQLYLRMGGVFAVLFGTGFAVFIWMSLFFGKHTPSRNLLEDTRVVPVCMGLWFILLSLSIGSMFLNFYPTVWTDERGITITNYLLTKQFICIPWEDLIDTREIWFGNILVRARKISLMHRLFSWQYSGTIQPGFIIGPGIDDRETLLREIRRHMPNRKAVIVV